MGLNADLGETLSLVLSWHQTTLFLCTDVYFYSFHVFIFVVNYHGQGNWLVSSICFSGSFL